MKSYLDSWKRCFDYSGRTTRGQFWIASGMHFLASFLWLLLALFLSYFLGKQFQLELQQTAAIASRLGQLYGIGATLCSISMSTRRLRDAGYSPKSFFWLLVPLIGGIGFLYRLCAKSAPEPDASIHQ